MKLFGLCIGYNMWYDEYTALVLNEYDRKCRDFLYFDKNTFKKIVIELPKLGYDGVLLDIAEGMKYDFAPEAEVKGSMSKAEIKELFDFVKEQGLKIVPRLDFSASHDIWLRVYSRMLSSSVYREMLVKLVDEVFEVLGNPDFFHIGMGDETTEYQEYYGYIAVRNIAPFWTDAGILFDAIRKHGTTPIISGELFFREPLVFAEMLPNDVCVDAHYDGIFMPESDDYGRDLRSDVQRKFETVFSLKNKILVSMGRADFNVSMTEINKLSQKYGNVIGFASDTRFATVERNKLAILNEANKFVSVD